MKKSISLLLLSLLMITPSCQKPKEVTNEYNIVPQPNQLVPKEGRFELSNKVRLVVPSDAPEVKKVADGFAEQLPELKAQDQDQQGDGGNQQPAGERLVVFLRGHGGHPPF